MEPVALQTMSWLSVGTEGTTETEGAVGTLFAMAKVSERTAAPSSVPSVGVVWTCTAWPLPKYSVPSRLEDVLAVGPSEKASAPSTSHL